MMRMIYALALSLLLLGGCAAIGDIQEDTSFTEQPALSTTLADKIVSVSNEHRPLRVCLIAAGVIEIMTDRIQVFDSTQAPEALGRLVTLQAAVNSARLADPLWMESDMTDVAFQFAHLLREVGEERLSATLAGGFSVSNFIEVSGRTLLVSAKGRAVLTDINNMLSSMDSGTLTETNVWKACNERIDQNKHVLEVLGGVRTVQ